MDVWYRLLEVNISLETFEKIENFEIKEIFWFYLSFFCDILVTLSYPPSCGTPTYHTNRGFVSTAAPLK